MTILINQLKEARENLIKIVDEFPEKERETIFFGQWSLKDILSHLIGWANHQIDILGKLKRNEGIELPKNLKNSINIDFVSAKRKVNWGKIYQEFVNVSKNLIQKYESLPNRLWKKKFHKDRKTTPEDFIDIEIRHYNNTHGPQIKKALRKLSR